MGSSIVDYLNLLIFYFSPPIACLVSAFGHAYRVDGTLADTAPEQTLLDQVRPARCDDSAAHPEARFIHFWFSHPLFEPDSLVDLRVCSETGMMSASRFQLNQGTGWIVATRSPGQVGVLPKTIDLRLSYVICPLQELRECEVLAGNTTMMSLHGGSQLGSYEAPPEGRAFLSISVNRAGMTQQQFAVEAVLKDGRKLIGGVGQSGAAGSTGVGTLRFDFGVPIASVDRFRIGVREIQTREWRGLVLPPGAIASPEAPDAHSTDEIRLLAIQAAMASIHLGEGVLLGEHGTNPLEQTHDPETGLDIFWPIVGAPPGYIETFNATIRSRYRDQKAAQEEAN